MQLDPHTSYLFQVVAYNSEGDGPGSNIAGPYKTPEDTPDEPTTITIKDVEMGLANITWTAPLRPNGKVIGYAIRYRTIPDGKVHSLEVEGQRTWVIVRDLMPAAYYEFCVAAKTKAGTGRFKKKTFDFTWRKFQVSFSHKELKVKGATVNIIFMHHISFLKDFSLLFFLRALLIAVKQKYCRNFTQFQLI